METPTGPDVLKSIDPTTNEVIFETKSHSPEQISSILSEAAHAQQRWSSRSVAERAAGVNALGEALRRHREALAKLITAEMGKPITQAEAEIDKSIANCEFYSANGTELLAPHRVDTGFDESIVRFDPLGVVLAIMPWNFPVWQVVRLLAPAFLAGNAVVLKHAGNVSQVAIQLESAVRDAGLEDGLFAAILCKPTAVNDIIADDRIAAVSLTGSTPVGALVAAQAGKHLKKQVLELGGSDPFIVLDDADLDKAVAGAIASRNQNAGQSCVAAKRFLVHESIADEFTDRIAVATAALRVGDPTDRATDVGPLARPDLRDELAQQVERSVALGATVVVGGSIEPGPGCFYPPTVLTGLTEDMPVVSEETFGPVTSILAFANDDEAVRIANDTEYGLGASIWTADLGRAHELAARLHVGSVFVNTRVSSDPRLPFGGVKRSGYGRELGSFGLHELTNIKTVAVVAP